MSSARRSKSGDGITRKPETPGVQKTPVGKSTKRPEKQIKRRSSIHRTTSGPATNNGNYPPPDSFKNIHITTSGPATNNGNYPPPDSFKNIHITTSGPAANYENNSQSLLPIDPSVLTNQMHSALAAIPEHPDIFEQFSEMPLEDQLYEISQQIPSAGGGQKGGALSDAVNGFIKLYIRPAWDTAREKSDAGKNYVSVIASNYMNKIQTLATGAGLSGPNAKQNLQSILYGLAVLAAAWNLGVIQAVPVLTLYLIHILSSIATTAAALPAFPMIQKAVLTMTAAAMTYHYRDIPIGAYGLISSTTMPIFTALYARGDQAFQQAFPNFGQNMADGGAAQLQELRASIIVGLAAAKAKLQAARNGIQPGIDAIKGVGKAWRNSVNKSIETFIDGLAQAQTDIQAIRAFYTFLEQVGQTQGVVIPPPAPEAAAAIAGLIDPRIGSEFNDNNVVTGAALMGDIISNEISNSENPIDADEAAALLLALGNTAAAAAAGPASVEATDVNPHAAAVDPHAAGPSQPHFTPSTGHEFQINLRDQRDNAAAGKTNNNNNYLTTFTGGKAHRRRHRKTAKKSHKKKHTKKHKRKTTKTKKGKKGKKSKRHTKRRS